MKKIIKYRGRDVITGHWAYGYYYPSKTHHIIRDGDDNETIVLEKTIGEYINLTDDCDTQIYEGDVVNVKYTLKDAWGDLFQKDNDIIIKWNDETLRYNNPYDAAFSDGRGAAVKVIGNIYEK